MGLSKIIADNHIIEIVLRLLLMLSCVDEKLVICSSNAAFLLNASGKNFNDMNLKGLKLEDIDLSGGIFIRANLEDSKFRRVKLSSVDFYNSNLNHINWTDIETKQIVQLKGHRGAVQSIRFSPSGEVLASGIHLIQIEALMIQKLFCGMQRQVIRYAL